MKDQRQFKRVEKHFLAAYEIHSKDHELQDSGMALELDLSLNGLQLEIPGRTKVGDTLTIVLAIQERMITVIGDVIWVNPGPEVQTVGCLLTKVQKDYKDTLKSWLATG